MGKIRVVRPGGATQEVAYDKPKDLTLETVLPDGAGGLYLIGDRHVYRRDRHGRLSRVAADFKDLKAGAAALGPDRTLYLADATAIVRVGTDARPVVVADGFVAPFGVAVDGHGTVYVVDAGAHRVYRVEKPGKKVPVAGSGKAGHRDGQGLEAEFAHPSGIVLDAQGNLYVKESGRQENSPWMHIRKITPEGKVSTLVKIRRPGI
jgi:sugar lactone lactonase YvrE